MKIDPTDLPQVQCQKDPSTAQSLTSAVFHILRGSILYSHLEPGTKLRVAQLAEHFNVSLSAVREALARLSAEGLLVAENHRGFRVAPVSEEDLLDLTETRIDLECNALRRAIERGDEEWAEKARGAFDALRSAEGNSLLLNQRRNLLHSEFHFALIEACGSPWLLRLLTMLFERSERYRLLSVSYSRVRGEVAGEHKELFEAAVIRRNPDKACSILAHHTRQTTQALLHAEKGRIVRSGGKGKAAGKRGRSFKSVGDGLLRSA